MSDLLDRQLRAALSDLERHAPKAPKLKDIRLGGPVVLTSKRPSRWSPRLVVAAAAAVTVVVVGLAALIGSGGDPGIVGEGSEQASIEGIWLVESFTVDGSTTPVDAAAFEADRRRRPFIEIRDGFLTGWTGCNSLDAVGLVAIEAETLTIGEVIVTAVGCDLNPAEGPLLAVLWSESPITADVSESTLTIRSGSTSVDFIRADEEPGRALPQWQTSSELIDCSPFPIMGQNIPADEQDARPVLAAFPGVVTIEGSGLLGGESPWAYGLDADGRIIAVAAPGDITPPIIHLSACGDSFGLRSDYEMNLQGQAMGWVNSTGLNQFRKDVWDARFIELCASTEADIAALALRYVDEDADLSVRVDNALPTDEEAIEGLRVIWLSTCQAGLDSISAPTTLIDTTTTSLDAPSTTAVPGGTCSATGLEIEGLLDSGTLPLPVENARERLVALSLACDFEGLVGFAAENPDAQMNDGLFWGAAQTVDTLREHDAMYGSLRLLAVALATVPSGSQDVERVDPESGETIGERYYSWPPPADIPDGGSLADVWGPELLQAVASLNESTVDELVDAADFFGAYSWFRVGITEDGRWLFALTGD